MSAPGSQLAQTRPSSTTAATAYTATRATEVTRIIIANSSTATQYSLFHDDDGATYSEATALAFQVAIAANAVVDFIFADGVGGIVVSPSGTIGVKTEAANNLTFTVYGVIL